MSYWDGEAIEEIDIFWEAGTRLVGVCMSVNCKFMSSTRVFAFFWPEAAWL